MFSLPACSPTIEKYFKELVSKTEEAYALAQKARAKGLDPENKVDILLAASVAQRSEALISSLVPQLLNSGISQRITELEKTYSPGDWRIALIIAEEVAYEKFCKFESKIKAIEIGIRIGLAYTTQGVVAGPLEGIVEVKLKKRMDGKDYISIYYAGPIRASGGTAQVIPLLIADYLRKKFNIEKYDPTEEEIARYCTEVEDYSTRVARKQYIPADEEIAFIIKNLPIELNGDPTEELEVSNYKRVGRVETTRIRGGVALALTDGVPLKAKKVLKKIQEWGKDFQLDDWGWLADFIKLKEKIRGRVEGPQKEQTSKVTPDYYFLSEIVAGRPVYSHPMAQGGFRVRYGRSRMTGHGSWAISPITMRILKNYIATGTQLRVERPGKSTALTVCDYLDGPIIKLKDRSVVKLISEEQAQMLANEIEEILFMGDLLISHGDFIEQGSLLLPAGYCEEWWALEAEKAMREQNLNTNLLSQKSEIVQEKLDKIFSDPIKTIPTAKESIRLSQSLGIPLHPFYTAHWTEISKDQSIKLLTWLNTGKITDNKFVLPLGPEKRLLELIGLPHYIDKTGNIVIDEENTLVLRHLLNLTDTKFSNPNLESISAQSSLELINAISPIKIRDKSGFTIGARMGRPEKSKMRKLKGTPHVLFPVGKEGGRLRSFQAALELGYVNSDFPLYECKKCKRSTIYPTCEICDSSTTAWRICPLCKKTTTQLKCHTETKAYARQKLDIAHYIDCVKRQLGFRDLPLLIKGIRGTSNKDHLPENLAKGILRARHNVFVNKDGTIRYDMTELGITHFKPSEIGLPVKKAKELGYLLDIYSKPLEREDQILEIRPQDVILPACPESVEEGADIVLLNIANFVDDELQLLYGLPAYYKTKKPADLIGHLIIGVAPHTSAGIIGRVIGFSKTLACFAHPYWHDAQRRDLDGEETAICLLMDALLNFSKQFLPNKRGGRSMDAPLVVTTILNPAEIDDEVYDVNTCWKYPLEFYEATLRFEPAYAIKTEQIKQRIGKPEQYEGMGYTHPVTDMNMGVRLSAYKSIPTMLEKVEGQIELAKTIRAVNFQDVARLVIEGHLIRDIKGNLRKFTTQEFRCINCNEIYRRPPMSGICQACKGKLVFTIAEGTVKKYLESAIKLAKYGDVPNYVQQSLEIIQRRINSVWPEDKTKQINLGGFLQ